MCKLIKFSPPVDFGVHILSQAIRAFFGDNTCSRPDIASTVRIGLDIFFVESGMPKYLNGNSPCPSPSCCKIGTLSRFDIPPKYIELFPIFACSPDALENSRKQLCRAVTEDRSPRENSKRSSAKHRFKETFMLCPYVKNSKRALTFPFIRVKIQYNRSMIKDARLPIHNLGGI
nr:uncharacterized protein LOC117281879 [Nicotiana tomentosiformis]